MHMIYKLQYLNFQFCRSAHTVLLRCHSQFEKSIQRARDTHQRGNGAKISIDANTKGTWNRMESKNDSMEEMLTADAEKLSDNLVQ